MADSRWFVQFSHPGWEHEPDRGGGKAWNSYAHSHMRKFMQLRGAWVSEAGDRVTGDLRAWGEWEPESELIRELDQPNGNSRYPRYLWHPYYAPKDDYRELHNTDPFIFGDHILYSNCGQPSKKGLTHLGEGSVIAFGSGKKIDGERKWMLDTVLVVREFVDYGAPEARMALEDWGPEAFLVATGEPLIDNNEEAPLRLYQGATPDDPVDGMFSFFPATLKSGDSGFPRPLIELPSEYFNPRSWQAPKGLWRGRSADELRGLWESLVQQVRDAGLVLGTYAELPERRDE